MQRKKTKNTYEATWYLIHGAKIINVRTKVLSRKQRNKKGYVKEWTIYLENVSEEAIKTWQSEEVICNIKDVIRERQRLKRNIKKFIYE